MTTFIQFALLGLGAGAAYTLLAQGLVLAYRGSGVLNFAQGAFALIAAFLFLELRQNRGLPFVPAFLVAVVATAVLGALVYDLIMRPLAKAAAVTRVIATLGLMILIQNAAVLIWGPNPQSMHSSLPTSTIALGDVYVGIDRVIMFAIAAALTAVLWAASRFTTLGLALRAASDNPTAAASLGWSPITFGRLTWLLSSAVAAVAGILIAPLSSVSAAEMPMLVVPVLAAALFGSLKSFPVAFLASMLIGAGQSVVGYYVHVQGAAESLPFLLIIAVLVLRGRGLPGRGHVNDMLPEVGSGRVRLSVVIPIVVIVSILVLGVFPVDLVDAVTVTMGWALLLLSVTVLLGYAGQLSLAQFAVGGLAALLAGKLVNDAGLSFAPAMILSVALIVPVAILISLPALRTRGMDLAVISLGVCVAVTALVFTNGDLTGGAAGIPTGDRSFFGIDIDPLMDPSKYALFVFFAFVVCALVVANVRRGTAGRRLLAIRTNERAAASLGISVFAGKGFAFTLASVVAAVGGVALAFKDSLLIFENYQPMSSLLVVAFAIVGGVGYLSGSVLGATLATGAIGSWILTHIFDNPDPAWLGLVGGVGVIMLAVQNPNGLAGENLKLIHAIGRRIRKPAPEPPATPAARTPVKPQRCTPTTLEVDGLTVRYGGVTAVSDVKLTVRPGEVLGLIGPNGAGKTSLIDAVTGFTVPATGEIRLNGKRIDTLPAHLRARAGIARSFQSLELFETSTVQENIFAACDDGSLRTYLTDLVRPRTPVLTPEAEAALEELDLVRHRDEPVESLAYGKRRLLAIARAVAQNPTVVLLDEPAAGLSGHEVEELRLVVRRLADEWGFAILVVEHDMSFVMRTCDRITVLNFGEQIAYGTPEEIQADPAVVKAYLGQAAGEGREPVDAKEAR
ncbi:branched-chain amino acid ABC transporter permease/ATP-binding protein [Microbispora sp. NBRC 16548]|uniref:branched-chain amino acid ABC transporter permease/ATP-binding protein n=1 Tax=Microbispora sp. NBRC 16548 TaxID=3030994 RepID=UPI0024A0C379|nr:branched-chain amino acid ABC transporter permease/ATP-binding protein [Microbispora sp. NBRC 16548]GLX11159.1 ABC transporter [Microbispora sp. NBRC 16548]